MRSPIPPGSNFALAGADQWLRPINEPVIELFFTIVAFGQARQTKGIMEPK